MRVLRWPENSGSIAWNDITVPVWSDTYPRTCPGPGGKDMCRRADSRILTGWVSRGVVGFMWIASQGGSFPYPYIDAATFKESDMTYLGRPYIAYGGGAALYPAVAVNARGDLGIVLNYGGGANYPSVVYGLSDDYDDHTWSTVFAGISSNIGPASNVWGDYNSAAPFAPTGLVWVGAGHILWNCGSDIGCSWPTYFIFGRSRDMRSLTHYWDVSGIFAPFVRR